MKSFKILTIISLFFFTGCLFGQKEIGKILSPGEAQILFGSVTLEKEIPVAEINTTISYAVKNVAFTFQNEDAFVLSDNKTRIYPVGKNLNPGTIVHIFSKSKVEEFLATNPAAKTIKVQKRNNVLCLSNDVSILEFSSPCPPDCW